MGGGLRAMQDAHALSLFFYSAAEPSSVLAGNRYVRATETPVPRVRIVVIARTWSCTSVETSVVTAWRVAARKMFSTIGSNTVAARPISTCLMTDRLVLGPVARAEKATGSLGSVPPGRLTPDLPFRIGSRPPAAERQVSEVLRPYAPRPVDWPVVIEGAAQAADHE